MPPPRRPCWLIVGVALAAIKAIVVLAALAAAAFFFLTQHTASSPSVGMATATSPASAAYGQSGASVLAYAPRGAGPAFQYGLLRRLTAMSNRTLASGDNPPGQQHAGLLPESADAFDVKGPLRSVPCGAAAFAAAAPYAVMLTVRDPRDVLVGEYYAQGFATPAPAPGPDRDAFLERRAAVQAQGLEAFATDPGNVRGVRDDQACAARFVAARLRKALPTLLTDYTRMAAEFATWLPTACAFAQIGRGVCDLALAEFAAEAAELAEGDSKSRQEWAAFAPESVATLAAAIGAVPLVGGAADTGRRRRVLRSP